MRQFIISILFVTLLTSFASADVSAAAISEDAANSKTVSKLTLDQAIINVLERSPMLKAADYESKAAAAHIEQRNSHHVFKAQLN